MFSKHAYQKASQVIKNNPHGQRKPGDSVVFCNIFVTLSDVNDARKPLLFTDMKTLTLNLYENKTDDFHCSNLLHGIL